MPVKELLQHYVMAHKSFHFKDDCPTPLPVGTNILVMDEGNSYEGKVTDAILDSCDNLFFSLQLDDPEDTVRLSPSFIVSFFLNILHYYSIQWYHWTHVVPLPPRPPPTPPDFRKSNRAKAFLTNLCDCFASEMVQTRLLP